MNTVGLASSFFNYSLECLAPMELDKCTLVCKMWRELVENSAAYQRIPHQIGEGRYGATIVKDGEPLYLRLELITEINAPAWSKFKDDSELMANNRSRGMLSTLLIWAKQNALPLHDPSLEEALGFDAAEYQHFTQDLISKVRENKYTAITQNCVGSGYMSTSFDPESLKYICYISKSPTFDVVSSSKSERTLKSYISSYNDILICVGSNFTEPTSFHNRGIFRNPYWILQGRFGGLSMLLHEFTGVVAQKYFPEKNMFTVKPVGSMLAIIQKNLLPGDGHFERDQKDITSIAVSPFDPEFGPICVKISALARIYYGDQKVAKLPSQET